MGARDDIVEFLLLNGVGTTIIDKVRAFVCGRIELLLFVTYFVRPVREPSIMLGS